MKAQDRMKALSLDDDMTESASDRRARHEAQHNRMRMNREPSETMFAGADRRLLHGAMLATGKDVDEGLSGSDENAGSKSSATVDPSNDEDGEDDDDEQNDEPRQETFFSKKLRRSTPKSREALLKLLASSKKKARVTFDFGLRGMRDDLISAVTFKRPIKPTSRLRTIWDAAILSFICYGLFMIPFDIAFDVDVFPWIVFDIALDFFFILDLGMNFLTAYMSEDNELVMDFVKIRHHYLKTWFLIDLVASLPFGLISYLVAQGSEALQVIKLLKAFRLFRMSHLYRAVAGLNALKGPFLVGVLMVFFGIAAHWFACIFWKIGVAQGKENSWIVYQTSIRHLQDRPQVEQYFVCLYWAMMTITTLGYGDITPHTFVEVLYVTFVIFCGAAMYAILISSVSMIVVGRFTAESEYNRHMDSLQAFSRLYHLPPDVTRRLTAYYDFIWERRRNFSNQSIMDDLPFELRATVAGAVHHKMIQHNPLLASCDSFGFKHMFAAKISQIVLRLPDEVLNFEGDEVNEVFFVRRGLVDIVVGLDTVDELVVGKRQDGGHCGDIGMFSENKMYAASSVTVHFSEVCSISGNALLTLLNQFPRERALFEQVAKARAAAIERLLVEFDELAAGKAGQTLNDGGSPRAAEGGLKGGGQKNFLTRLFVNNTNDSDFEFFWKLWETAVSPESDEALVEETVRQFHIMHEDDHLWEHQQHQQHQQTESLERNSSMKSNRSSSLGATVTYSSFQGPQQPQSTSPKMEPNGFTAGTGQRKFKSYMSENAGVSVPSLPPPRRSSTEVTDLSMLTIPDAKSPSLRPRGDSAAGYNGDGHRSVQNGVDSLARELDMFTHVPSKSKEENGNGSNPFDAAPSSSTSLDQQRFQQLVLAKLEEITSRLELLEAPNKSKDN